LWPLSVATVIWSTSLFRRNEQFEQICAADAIRIRISGENAFEEPSECEKFHTHCRQFYNGFYDTSKYAEAAAKGCFVATATMGDCNHPTVRELKKFRENYLLHREWGRIFVRVYYKWSPYPASVIENNYWLKKLSYLFIVKPLLFIALKLKEYN